MTRYLSATPPEGPSTPLQPDAIDFLGPFR